MNLLGIMTGQKASPEDLASAVVEIEGKIAGGRTAIETAEQEALKLHQLRLGGEKVREEDIDTVEKKVSAAQRNLKAAEITLTDLKTKLKEAVIAKISKDKEDLEKTQEAFRKKFKAAEKEYFKQYAALKALQIFINGPDVVQNSLVCDPEDLDSRTLLHAELESALSQQEKPSLWGEKNALDNLFNTLRDSKVEDIVEALIKTARNTN